MGSVIVNRNIPAFLPEDALEPAADGIIDADAVRAGLSSAGITMAGGDFAGCSPRYRARQQDPGAFRRAPPTRGSAFHGWICRRSRHGVDLGSLYELAEALAQQGVR